MKIKIDYLHKGMKPLEYKHCYDAGADVYMYEDVVLKPGTNTIPLGFSMCLPPGYAGYMCLRSSIMGNGVVCNMAPVDSDYKGEWHLVVYNSTKEDIVIPKNNRICQVVIMPILQAEFVSELPERRGFNGLGSSGK